MNVSVVSRTKVVKVDFAPSGPAYAVGDAIGTSGGSGNDAAKIPLPLALSAGAGSAVLNHVTLFDARNQKPPLTLLIFSGKPAGNYPDNGAILGFQGQDGAFLLIGQVSIAAADWVTVPDSGGNAAVVTKTNLGLVCRASEDLVGHPEMTLYAVLVSGGTPDWVGGTEELVGYFGFLH